MVDVREEFPSWEWTGPLINHTSTELAIEYLQQFNRTAIKRGGVYCIHGEIHSSQREFHNLILLNNTVYGELGACIYRIDTSSLSSGEYVFIQNPGGSIILGVVSVKKN